MTGEVNWARARWHAEQALALRPGDGPLLELLRFTAAAGVVVGERSHAVYCAPPGWPGYRVLEGK